MKVTIKDSKTVVLELHPAIKFALDAITLAFSSTDARMDRPNLRITGLQEQGHKLSSFHYGIPGDLRCRAIDEHGALLESDLDFIRALLGVTFFVAWETDHMHIQFMPTRAYSRIAHLL